MLILRVAVVAEELARERIDLMPLFAGEGGLGGFGDDHRDCVKSALKFSGRSGFSRTFEVDQALEIKNTQIAEELALPPVKIHCSILAEDAIKAAVADYKKKHEG